MPVEYHPIFVHFPIALSSVALVFDLGRWVFDRRRLLEAGFWGGTTPILLVAFLGAIASVFTGLGAKPAESADAVVHQLVEAHQTMAITAISILSLLVFWRLGIRGRFPSRLGGLYLVLLLGLVVVIGYGAYFGGQMVYSHGVGVDAVL